MNVHIRSFGILIGFALTWVLGLCCCSHSFNETIDNAASEVEAREIAFAKTFAERSIESFFEFVSTEAVFFNGNEPLRGHDAIAQVWGPLFEADAAPFSWHPDVIEVLESGDLALSSGPVKDESGEILGRFNSVWRREKDGQWRVVFDKGS